MKFAGGLFFFLSLISGLAFTASDADTAFRCFTTAFYVSDDGFGHFRERTGHQVVGFWTQAEQIEMIEDAWERTGSPESRRMISQAIAGFTNRFGTDWSDNKYNDDLMWMTIACTRAYLITTNHVYLELAQKNFHVVSARAGDDALGGGWWWSTDRTGKNACINGPAAIAACLLYQSTGDRAYLTSAQAIYAWERRTLVDPETSGVRDNIGTNGSIAHVVFSYNQGTYIGAADLLWKITGDTTYFNDALQAANYAKSGLCVDGILPAYGSGDAAGFNGICMRWLARFVRDNQLWPQFYEWMTANADAAWSVRRTDNLSWQDWHRPTPPGRLAAWNCSDTVVILQVVPARPPAKKTYP